MREQISAWGKIKDPSIENAFFTEYMDRSLRFLKPMVLAMGILYLLFLIPDYFLNENITVFSWILCNRLFFFFAVLLLVLTMDKIKNMYKLAFVLTLYEILAGLLFLNIMFAFENPTFLIQFFSLMLIIQVVFLIPNQIKNMMMAALILIGGFIFLTMLIYTNIPASQWAAGIVYLFLLFGLNMISVLRNHIDKRVNHLQKLKLERMSMTDPLTGIYNRFQLDRSIQRFIQDHKKVKCPFSLILFDIDDFKKINDQYGHLTGDDVIVELTQLVSEILRKEDVFVRFGGEEFAILLPNIHLPKAHDIAQRVRKGVENHPFPQGEQVTCSFGVAEYQENMDVEAFINQADRNVYESKNTGKNRVSGL